MSVRSFLAARFKGTAAGDVMVAGYQRLERAFERSRSVPARLPVLGRTMLKSRQAHYVLRYYGRRIQPAFAWLRRSDELVNFTYDLTDQNKLYLAHALALPLGCSPGRVRALFAEAENDRELAAHLAAHGSAPLFARRLVWYAIARQLRPGLIVETGVDRGVGAVLLCAALLRNTAEGAAGRYVGLDISLTAGALFRGRYAAVGRILYGDSLDTLAALDGPIDLFINDSDHTAAHERREYEIVRDKLSTRAIVVGDNAHVTAELAAFATATGRHFLYLPEMPKNHWYLGGAAGVAFVAGTATEST